MNPLYKTHTLSYSLILFLLFFPLSVLLAQTHKGMSGVEVVKTSTQEVLNVNIGFFVEFKNTNAETVDALKYTVTYYDGFDEKMGEKDFKWQSGNIVKPVASGKTVKDYHANWIKGANKIKVVITKVHFVDKDEK